MEVGQDGVKMGLRRGQRRSWRVKGRIWRVKGGRRKDGKKNDEKQIPAEGTEWLSLGSRRLNKGGDQTGRPPLGSTDI